ncbi:Aerotolerance protein BatC [hydrothermal vent metagenome]|uniref:Aerotolerance protein BatC n=1 Tax=hydrothermal vent metagenome TaxID=652676 RepID=A0A3B0RCU4_9ZZZZ
MSKTIIYIALLITTASFAQQKDKALRKSNDFIFEGNALVNDDFVAAEKEYRKALSKKPNNTIGAYNLGNAYYETGNFDEALLRHIEAAKLATTKADKHKAYHNIGNILMQQKQCKEAVEAFKNALRNDPTDEETRYNLVVAKECAEQQQQNEDKNKDKDKKDEKKKDDDKKKDDKKDKGDKDKKDGDDKKDDNGKPKNEKNNEKEGKPKNEKKQPQPGKLSPQQVKNLLEAMNNEEKKVQQKINAKKAKGKKVKAEKDW